MSPEPPKMPRPSRKAAAAPAVTPPAGRERGRLVLIDIMGLIFRSYYALSRRAFTSASGEPTGAVYGVTVTLLKILREERPDYLAVLFDRPEPTFRHKMHPGYKASRPPMPEDLVVQLPRVREVLAALDLTALDAPGFEADDLIGTLALRGRDAGLDVEIWSGDKDLLQLVGGSITAAVPGKGIEEAKRLDREGVKEKLGVLPEQVVDYLALVGDAVDDVPGVPGIGPVGAAQLLGKFGSLDALYERLDEVERPAVREKLRATKEAVERNREILRIETGVPLEVEMEALRLGPISRDKVMPVFREMSFRRLMELLPASGVEEGAAPTAEDSGTSAPADPAHADSAPPGAPARPTDLGPFFRRARAAEWLAVLPATRRLPAGMVGLEGIALGGVPAGVSGGEDALELTREALAEGGVLHEDVRALLRDPGTRKVTTDLKTLHRALHTAGLSLGGNFLDADMARRMCEGTASEEEEEGDAEEADAAQTLLDFAGQAGEEPRAGGSSELERARALAREAPDLLRRVEAAGLVHLYHEIEVPLAAVLAVMEENGIAVDRDELRRLSREMGERIAGFEKEIHELAGGPFNINSTRQLKEVLFGKLGLSPGRRTRTGFSTDAEVLARLAREHPLPGLILRHRHLTKLRSTYAEALAGLVNPETGRIHTTFNAMGAATGRISSRDPNLQNIPIRTEEGKAFRRVFVPSRPGWHLVGVDYSQIELRILAHVTGEEGLIEAFHAGMDFHTATSAKLLGVAPEKVTREIRDRAKAVNYGIIYGMGPRSLAQGLGIEESEAREFIGSYFARYPKVDGFIKGTLERARASGFVTTIEGRRRVLPDLASTRGDLRSMAERAAVNAVIQGSAADIMKAALVAIHRLLTEMRSPARLLLTVHDEIVLEAPADETLPELVRRVSESMRGVAELRVPLEVSAGHGANWLEAHG